MISMKLAHFQFNPRRGFTLVEMLIVITIIAILAGLTMGAYTYAMRSSKRRLTTGTFEAVKSALDNYNTEFGEYPEPVGKGQMMELIPGKSYDTSGAACLYQALSGDGYDKIKGVSGSGDNTSGSSDGKTEGVEVKNIMLKEMPQSMYIRRGSAFLLVDGFGRPFQYIKAKPADTASSGTGNTSEEDKVVTINTTYDLWSYGEDEVNITKKSSDALKDPKTAIKWIKNW
jgi:prepilin-type N-terminal cleavage/methylation domain-containing protein